jgi:protein-disulfide isomerase
VNRVAADAEDFSPIMKRFLPFFIIAAVALLTVSIAAVTYRAKTRPAPAPAASDAGKKSTPTAPEAPEDPFLHARGPRNAPVTLEIYGDFQCPSCALATQAVDELQKQYDGKMRVIFHEFPLEMHKHAVDAALAAEAAAIQGKFWEMHDMLYQYQPVWSRASNVNYLFESYAESLGLDVARFRADRLSPDVRAHILEDGGGGQARGVKNTPTIFINGSELRSGFTKGKMQETIEAALTSKRNS